MSCAGADGTCDRPVDKGGLCAAHRYRLTHHSPTPLAAPVRERLATPFERFERAVLEYQDELDTKTDEEFQRGRERLLKAMRPVLRKYVALSIRRYAGWSAKGRAEAELFLKVTYGDTARGRLPRTTKRGRGK